MWPFGKSKKKKLEEHVKVISTDLATLHDYCHYGPGKTLPRCDHEWVVQRYDAQTEGFGALSSMIDCASNEQLGIIANGLRPHSIVISICTKCGKREVDKI